jgi:cell division protein FtsQ
MTVKKNIRKIAVITGWCLFAAALIVVLVAAIQKKDNATCKAIVVEINNGGGDYFLSKQDVLKMIGDDVIGKPVEGFNIRRLEKNLEKNVWVKHAELFFDNSKRLRVELTEREPVARVFDVNGNSFYIDTALTKLPLHENMVVSLPVFTNYPATGKKLNSEEKKLMTQVKDISMAITADLFWNAQIAQVDVTAQQNFEMVPLVGNHIIQFGNGDSATQKFHNLMLFYKNVLSKTGMNKYAMVNVQYYKQVVGTKRGGMLKYDSLQALKNIKAMIEKSKQLLPDTLSTPVDKKPAVNMLTDSSLRSIDLLPPSAATNENKDAVTTGVETRQPVVNKNPNPVTIKLAKPSAIIKKAANGKPQPRAVMKKM